MNKKELLFILIITFTVCMVWIVSNIFYSQSKVVISPKLQETLQSVNPNFDQDTLNKISQQP